MSKLVALVEDEPFITEALVFLLENDGFETCAFADGAGAVTFIQEQRPDVVILDLMLPNQSGMQILERLRASDWARTLPVLMLTAKGQSKDRKAARSAGVSRFMTKPFSNQELLETVRELASV